MHAVLAASHLRLDRSGMLSYAQSCPFRGHHMPHLAVQTDLGPVTVMILVHESVAKAQPFDQSGYRGIRLPVPGHGCLAVPVNYGESDLPRGGARRGARQARDRLDRVTAGLQTIVQLDDTKRGRGLTQHYASSGAHDGQKDCIVERI
jgi:hypothetical protein